ncbi:MAG: DTW domain-containing protein [Deltaproteobacteria bacterium]|nr:DTW domain-containing protein [Deltaproteobacteria bacterium]
MTRGQSNPEGRPTCFSCFRPTSHCTCSLVEPFAGHTNVLILQHPHERKKYYSTAKIVVKGMTNAQLVRGIEFEPGMLDRCLQGKQGYLLYPSPGAIDCEDVKLDSNSTVVVVDGTWAEAGKIVYCNPRLKELPCLTFKRPLRSTYRIRKQPREHYLSTLESIAYLLKLNAAAQGKEVEAAKYDRLLDGFAQMVEQQLCYIEGSMNFARQA